MKGAIYAYPLIENAIRGNENRSILEHNKVMGEILEKFANIAKDNPLADRRIGYSAETISSVSAVNPYIGFPYTKLMNANAFIDQSAAIIITSVKNAKELGIPKNKTYIMPAGDTRETLIKMYPLVFNMCVEHGYNMTGRDHIIAFDTQRGV